MVSFNPNSVVGIDVYGDVATADRCGASGTFQVISVTLIMDDNSELDVTENVDQGEHYFSADDVAKDLGLNPNIINVNIDFE